MTKILIVPDVHGRNFWRKPLEETEVDHVVFLGDYTDPYPDEATPEDAINEFRDIINWKKNYPDNITLLLGNHDCFYYSPEYAKAMSYHCREDRKNFATWQEMFEEVEFKIAYQCDNEKYGKVLFTHAGVTNKFKHICGLDADQINKFFLKESSNDISNMVGLAAFSWYRGGYSDTGSPVWADVREHMKSQVPQVFQIFGHTYAKDIIIMDHFAMLDRGDSCFILDENGITKV